MRVVYSITGNHVRGERQWREVDFCGMKFGNWFNSWQGGGKVDARNYVGRSVRSRSSVVIYLVTELVMM